MNWLILLSLFAGAFALSSVASGDIFAIEPNATHLSQWYLPSNNSRGTCVSATECVFYMWAEYEIWNGHGGYGCVVVGSRWHYVNESYAPWARWACFDEKFAAPIAPHSYNQFNGGIQYEDLYYSLLVQFPKSWIMAKFRL